MREIYTYIIFFSVIIIISPFLKILRVRNLAWDFLGPGLCPHSIIPVTGNPKYPPGSHKKRTVGLCKNMQAYLKVCGILQL